MPHYGTGFAPIWVRRIYEFHQEDFYFNDASYAYGMW